MKSKHVLSLAFSCSMLFAFGCDNSKENPAANDVTVKTAPADPGNAPQPANAPAPTTEPAPSAAPALAAAGAGERQSAEGVSWELPAGWRKGADAPMRLATITDGQADIAITAFPGDVGGSAQNLNRWRGQVGLPPVNPDEAEKQFSDLDVNGVKLRLLDLTGQQRMLVATVPANGKLFFFKMTGPLDVIAARKDVFMQFVKSIRVG